MPSLNLTAERTASVLGHFQSAALGETSWHNALAGFAGVFGGPAAQLFAPSVPGGFAVCGTDRGWIDAYVRYYSAMNPVLSPLSRATTGTAVADWGLVERRAFESSEFYNDFIAPQGISHGAVFVLEAAAHGSPPALLKVDRPHAAGPFTEAELKLLGMLGVHVRTTLAISARLARAEAERNRLAAVHDCFGDGLVLLCPHGRVLHANAAAEVLLAAHDGVARTRSGELIAAEADDAAPLGRALARVLRRQGEARQVPGGVAALCVKRRSAAAGRLSVFASSLPRGGETADALDGANGAAAAMVLLVPAAGSHNGMTLPFGSLSAAPSLDRFGLTPAEARAALLLAERGTGSRRSRANWAFRRPRCARTCRGRWRRRARTAGRPSSRCSCRARTGGPGSRHGGLRAADDGERITQHRPHWHGSAGGGAAHVCGAGNLAVYALIMFNCWI